MSELKEKNDYQAEIFKNRIAKKYRELKKWARKNRITCFRIYDRDIPEVPLCLDIYEFLPEGIETPVDCRNFIYNQNERQSANDPKIDDEIAERRYGVLYLYERPYEKDENEETEWLNLMAEKVTEVFKLPENHVILKQRKHQKGLNQYEKSDNLIKISELVQEQGTIFKVDLTSYIDTGLFFDHRPLRSIIRDTSRNKSVLNLFCYTGSISIYAASGEASRVESVDLSNTYLGWAKENFLLNGFSDKKKYIFTKDDVFHFLNEKLKSKNDDAKSNRYDIIVLDPPTFSNSKMAKNTLDINLQWQDLVNKCLNLLNPCGTLYFSTNSKRLKFDESKIIKTTDSGFSVTVKDITLKTIPEDFAGKNPHKAFELKVLET